MVCKISGLVFRADQGAAFGGLEVGLGSSAAALVTLLALKPGLGSVEA